MIMYYTQAKLASLARFILKYQLVLLLETAV